MTITKKNSIENMKDKKANMKNSALLIAVLMTFVFSAIFAASAIDLTDTTQPTIQSVFPDNNQVSVLTHDEIKIYFSEPMDESTINEGTITVLQRTTPDLGAPFSEYRSKRIEGTVAYNGLTATFTPKNPQELSYNPIQPDQTYGNVFTVTVNTGAKDLAGNSLARNYAWSFTTGRFLFNTNTAVATSQLDQSPTTAAAHLTTSPAIAAPVTEESSLSSIRTSAWLMGGTLLLLLALSVIMLSISMRSANAKNKNNRNSRKDPFGDVHPVIALEGIGPKHKKQLENIGITNTHQLWKADPVSIANKTGVSIISVKSWQNMAELASVKDIGPQYSELLERSGVHSIKQLKNYDADKLLKLVKHKQNSLKINIQGNHPEHSLVENWIAEAKDHKLSEPKEGQTA